MSILTKPYFQARKNNGVLFEPDSTCVLWLPGQDDPQSAVITDRSGKGHNGAITGATWTRTGQGLWYQSYDGSNDKTLIANHADFNPATSLSIEMWIYHDPPDGSLRFPLGKCDGDGSYNGAYMIRAAQTGEHVLIVDGDSDVGLSITVPATTWSHILFAFSSGSGWATLNGVSVDTTTDVVALDTTDTNDFIIGWGYEENVARSYKGGIALFRFYSNSLVPISTAMQHFQQERHLFGV